tara:strand:+ start:394 stop:591 length:198 start_codon:yes stop_codon:yes gene_type:complete
MADSDKWSFLSASANPLPSRRQQPMDYTAPQGDNGYPNNIANTQTLRTRGTKLATKGNSSSTKMG